MSLEDGAQRTRTVLLALLTLVVLIAGLRAAQSIVVPVMLAVFLALLTSPVLVALVRRGVPTWMSVLIVVLGMVVLVSVLGFAVGTSAEEFSAKLPSYQAQFTERMDALADRFGERGKQAADNLVEAFDPGKAMGLAARLLSGVGGVLTNAALILLILVFILMEASSFPAKLRLALPDAQAVIDYCDAVVESVKRYFSIKAVISLATGVSAGGFVAFLGVDFPVLWGVLAFLMNFIPNIGSLLAAIPPVLLALVQFGPGQALGVAAGYLVINTIFGSILEPRLAGRGIGLSPLVVLLSLVFWGWVLGPVGMLLSVPLTATVKIALEAHPSTRWMAILLGSSGTAGEAQGG